jgi:hypothetical protein
MADRHADIDDPALVVAFSVTSVISNSPVDCVNNPGGRESVFCAAGRVRGLTVKKNQLQGGLQDCASAHHLPGSEQSWLS